MTAFDGPRSWSSAVGLLATARQRMVAVNEYMYSAASAAPWNLVISFLAAMKAVRLGNSVSRSAAMKSWSREGQWQVSLAALHGENSGSKSPAHSLTAAMAACERSDYWQHSLQIFRSQLTKDQAVCLNAAVCACSKGSNWQSALGILAHMSESSIEISEVTHNSAISACSKAREWQMALALSQEMRESDQPGPSWVDAALAGTVISIVQQALGPKEAVQLLQFLRRHWQQRLPPEPPLPDLLADEEAKLPGQWIHSFI
eukprot:s816_g8.t1